jgi:hypothetical protein
MMITTGKFLMIVLLSSVAGVLPPALRTQTTGPERTVRNNVITSERNPKVCVRLPESAHYVGADRWVLCDVADCELHAFVDADAEKNVHRLYWVQFEGYVASRPELHHTYDSPRHAELGGWDFYVDSWVRAKAEETRAGSDLQHIVKLVEGKGYRLPAGMMYVRFVHLLDEQKRQELMIIYAEDVGGSGHTPAELQQGGRFYDRWPATDKALVGRGEKAFSLER